MTPLLPRKRSDFTSNCANGVRVHFRRQSLDQLNNKFVSQLFAFIGNDFDGNKVAASLKNFLNFGLKLESRLRILSQSRKVPRETDI